MKNAELLKLCRELLKKMSENDIKIDDWKYANMYDEFNCMRKNGTKYNVAIIFLSDKYNVSEATIERVLRRLSKDI